MTGAVTGVPSLRVGNVPASSARTAPVSLASGWRTSLGLDQSFHWNTSTATFYAWRQYGYGVPPEWKIPGGYSGHFACGGRYLRSSLGIAHRTLPCGTIVRLCYAHRCVNVPVVDRFHGNGIDMTSETCLRINHCWTGRIQWRVVR
jgi:hypothetical protein